jgi:short-subunit dehydrogenase
MNNYAVITGASAGLGAEFSKQLAAKGLNLVLIARRLEKLEQAAEELSSAYGIDVKVMAADLTQSDAPSSIHQFCESENITVSWLVNNAGVAGEDLITERDWNKHASFYQLMMTSVAHLCHLFAPAMIANKEGHILNVASVAGRIPRSGGCNYGPSKAYIVALSEDLALTLAPHGVKVSALCPGYTHTDFHETAGLSEMKAKMPKWLWYDASTVVSEGIRALESGKSVYVSGRLYRWIDPILQSVWTRRFFKVPARI